MGRWTATAGAAFGLGLLAATGATAQNAPAQDAAPTQEALATSAPAATGPQWRVFSESEVMFYMADMSSIRTAGDESLVLVARVRKTADAGNYSHQIDTFAVRCEANDTRVTNTVEVFEDGEQSDSYPVEEPWTPVEPRTFDHAIKDIACGVMEPGRDPFPSIKAFIDAGRP